MLLTQEEIDELAKMQIEMIDLIFKLNRNPNYEKRENIKYLKRNNVSVYNNGYKYELGYSTPSGERFYIYLNRLVKSECLNYLNNFDINEKAELWWNCNNSLFDDIRDLYNDIKEWRDNFIKIVENMPY